MEDECETKMEADSTLDDNVMSGLFRHDLDQFLQCIFLKLDPVSLRASKLVCQQWYRFIRNRIWGSKMGRNQLLERLDRHWRKATPAVRKVEIGEGGNVGKIHCVSCDDKIVVCGLSSGLAKVYDIGSGLLLQTLNCTSKEDEPKEHEPDSSVLKMANGIMIDDDQDNEVQQDIGKEVVATVTEKGDVAVWSRSDWQLLYQAKHHGEEPVYGVKVVGGYILTGGSDGKLAVMTYEDGKVELVRSEGSGEKLTHVDSDGEWVLTGNSSQLSLYHLPTHSFDKILATPWVSSLALSYPHAITVGTDKGVAIWNLQTEEVIRRVSDKYFWQIHNNGRFLSASMAPIRWWVRKQSVVLFNIKDLTKAVPVKNGDKSDKKQDVEDIWSRKKVLDRSAGGVSASLNTTSLVVAQDRLVYIWDFWNSDEFNDIDDGDDESDDDDDEFGIPDVPQLGNMIFEEMGDVQHFEDSDTGPED